MKGELVPASDLDELIKAHFPDVAVNKGLSREVGIGERAIPDFVRDWLISRFASGGYPDFQKIRDFLEQYLPDKKHANRLKSRLLSGEELTLLDSFSAEAKLEQGRHVLKIPSLDVYDAHVHDDIVEANPLMLLGPVWGAGRLVCRRDPEDPRRTQLWMDEFRPMQTSIVNVEYFISRRRFFSFDQWRELLVRSMGYNPGAYSPEQQLLMLVRLVPLVQPRVNLIELAPKGTGKSYVFSQLSKNSWLISGGVVTRAKLFYDMRDRVSGVIARYDVVVFDEVQTIKLDDEGEILGALKGYLESGEYHVMGFHGTSDAGVVLLANIPMLATRKPKEKIYFESMPVWLRGKDASALLDRFHGLLPGWELPRIRKQCLATGLGLRADYLAEVLHELRLREEYNLYLREHLETSGDLRDIRAVQRIAVGLLRLLYPDLTTVTTSDFLRHCVEPAKQLRSAIRAQLSLMDEEYQSNLATVEVV